MPGPLEELLGGELILVHGSGLLAFVVFDLLLREILVVLGKDGELDAQPFEQIGVSLLVVLRQIVVAHLLITDLVAKFLPESLDVAPQVTEIGSRAFDGVHLGKIVCSGSAVTFLVPTQKCKLQLTFSLTSLASVCR